MLEKIVKNALLLLISCTTQQCNWKLRKSMIRKVKVQADRFDIEMKPNFGQPMTYEERLAREKAIGEMNMVKKIAAAKTILEGTIERAHVKAQKRAAKGKSE